MPPIRHILFPYDFSAQARQVVPFVRTMGHDRARITLLSVVPPAFDRLPPDVGFDVRVGPDVADWIRTLQTRLDAALVPEFADAPIERLAIAGDPALQIATFAHDQNVDLIMMPTHGLGLFRTMLIGSVTSKVLHDVRCPVWTAAHAEVQTAAPLPRTVLCAVDGGAGTPTLLQWAAAFSRTIGAALQVLHVVGPVTDWPSLPREQRFQEDVRKDAQSALAALMESLGLDAALRVPVGHIVPTVADEARYVGADLVIIGRGSVAGPFGRLRTHAFGIVQRSPCPVISV